MLRERYHPTPPHPTPALDLVWHQPCVQGQGTPPDPSLRSCVAPTMCARPKKLSSHPAPPHPTQPQISCRIDRHVCKAKERYHPTPPEPSLRSCVASTMCARPKNVIIPPHPTRPLAQILCGIDHVLGW